MAPDIGGNETIAIRVIGDSASAVAATNAATASVERLGGASKRAAGDFSLMRASARRTEQSIQSLGRQFTQFGKGAAVVGGLGLAKFVKDGLAFTSSMEQNRVAFTQFLGSAKAAEKQLKVLYQLAKTTPFEFADVTLASRKFAAFGFTVKESNELLRTLADTASGLALDKSGIDRMVLAIGQIKSKGILMSQDLRQLQELGAIDMSKLAKDLGLTAKEMGDVGKMGVPSVAALQAIERQWKQTFGGQSMKQAKTFAGLLSTLKDNYKQFAGSLTSTPFDASKSLMGRLNKELTAINDEYQKHPKLTLSAKIEIAKEHLEPVAREVGKQIGDAIGDANLDEKLVEALNAALPVIAKAAGHLGIEAAKAFGKAFIEGDGLTKLVLGAFFISKFVGWGNIFRKMGAKMAASFAADFALVAAKDMGAAVAADGAIGGAVAAKSKWGKVGRTAGKFFKGAFIAAATYELSQALEDALHGGGPNEGGRQSKTSGGQWDLSEWIADKLGINQGPTDKVKNTLGDIVGSIGGVTKRAAGGAAYREMARQAAKAAGIDPDLFIRQIGVESGFNPRAKSPAGALGIAQFMPGTAKGLGIDPMKPREALAGAAKLMADYIQKYGSWKDALVAYNAGPGRVGGKLPAETQKYIRSILGSGGGKGSNDPIKWKPVGGQGDTDTPGNLLWAQKMVGRFKESAGQNRGPELDRLEAEFGTSAAAWCAMFATKALVKAGFPKSILTASVADLNTWAKAGAKGLSFTTSPSPGDLMTFGNDHVATVEKVNRSKGTVTVIDGNSSKGEVSRSTRSISSGRYIATNAAAGREPFREDNRVKVPSLTQADFMNFLQGRIDQFDLMVGAGLLSPTAAAKAKSKAISQMLPNLRGNTKLKGLGMLRELGSPLKIEKAAEKSQWAKLAEKYMTAKDARTVDTTLDNQWLQASLEKTKGLVAAGLMSQAAGNALQSKTLQNALPGLTDANGLLAQGLIEGLKPDSVADAAALTSKIDLRQRAGDLGKGEIGVSAALKEKIATLQNVLATWDLTSDARLEIRAQLGDLTSALENNTAAQQDLSDFWKQQSYRLGESLAVSQAQYGVFSRFGSMPQPFLGGFDSGGIVPGPRGMPGYALVHGGETVLPTHKGGSVPVHVVLHAGDLTPFLAGAAAYTDRRAGRDSRQISIAPGR